MSAPASPIAHGELVSSGAGIPTFVGVLDKAVKRIVELHGLDDIRDGDCFITNDPYYGGVTHLNDVVIALPVFAEGECVAWAASIAHWNDVGGKTPGSMAVDVTEIFQEGLRLPAVKLFENGKPIARGVRHHRGQFAAAGFRARRSVGAGRGEPQGRDAHPPTGRHLWARRLSRRDRRPVRGRRAARTRGPRCAAARHASGSRKSRTTARSGSAAITISPERFRVDLSRQSEAAQRALQHQPRRRGDLRPDDLQGADRSDAVRQCRLVPRAGGDHRAGHDLPRRGHRAARLLFRDAHPALRHAVAMHGAGAAGAPAGRPFRLDLRHGDRRRPSRYRPALHHGRAADGRLGRNGDARRPRRHVFGQPRRHLQLPGRDLRGALRHRRRLQAPERDRRGQGPASRAARACRSATARAAAPCCRPATAATASRSGARPAARMAAPTGSSVRAPGRTRARPTPSSAAWWSSPATRSSSARPMAAAGASRPDEDGQKRARV